MSVEIKYKGNTIASASTDTTKTLKTSGKYCEADIEVINTHDGGGAPVINPLSVTANGTYNAPSGVDGYSPVTVNVPQGITPTGNINITDTNVTDVTNYATAQVVDANLVAANIKKDVNILGILGSFEGGGGGSLPTSISKLDGGSFTPASDTLVGNYTVSHNLGEAPKGVVIFSDHEGGAYSVETVSSALKVNNTQQYESLIDVLTTGSTSVRGQSITAGSLTTTGWYFKRNNTYYKAGVTYNWLAWA